jgi:aryl-alcohol dehydrogenase-like predicted oxidoreductase
MRFTKLGDTGLDVSVICVGCMSFGVPEQGRHEWTMDEAGSREIVRASLDAGINFFDTANAYSAGSSEEITGRALGEMADRDEIVLATKVLGEMREGPNGGGLSRKAILAEIDHSLERLGVDYVDLYQVHRWDYGTPIEETLEALDDVVRAGKARYIGASSMWAWQLAKSLHLQERHGWARYVSMQDHYNLLYREEEREVLPLCADAGLGVIPWSPLARGKLARPWEASTSRTENDAFGKNLYPDSDREIVERNEELAARLGVKPAQTALAWHLTKPVVTAPIVGVTKLGQLEDAIAAVEIELSEEDVAFLEEPYVPHPVAGHS